MRSTTLVATWMATTITIAGVAVADRIPQKLLDCCLYQDEEGTTWVRRVLLFYRSPSPAHDGLALRLSDDLAERYAPLRTQPAALPVDRCLYGELPLPSAPEGAAILLDFHDIRVHALSEQTGECESYEIVDARLVEAEFISHAWVKASRTLDRIYHELSSADADARSDVKRMDPLVRQANEALEVFHACKDEWQHHVHNRAHRTIVNPIRPDTRVVRIYQHGAESRMRKLLAELINDAAFATTVRLRSEQDAKPEVSHRAFGNCFLYPDTQDRVWLAQPLASLGMIGTVTPPMIQIDPKLAEQWAPLVDTQARLPADRTPFFFFAYWFPRNADLNHARYLISMKATMRRVENSPVETSADDWPIERPHYLIESADDMRVEYLSSLWFDHWRELDEAISEIVETSLQPVDRQKRRTLAESLEKGARALRAMDEHAPGEADRERVEANLPGVRWCSDFQAGIRQHWGGQLSVFARRLGLKTDPPIPDIEPYSSSAGCQTTTILAQSASAEEFLRRVEESCGSSGLNRQLFGSKALGRLVYVWEVGTLTPKWFEALKTEANDRRAEEAAAQREPHNRLKQRLGITAEPVDESICHDKLILRGVVVKGVNPAGESLGFQPADIILNYKRVYDLVMLGLSGQPLIKQLEGSTRNGGDLHVLRGDRIVMIKLPPAD